MPYGIGVLRELIVGETACMSRSHLDALFADLPPRLNVAEVADLLGVSDQTVYQWLGGDIPLDRIGPLADYLGQPVVIRIGADDKST